MARWLLAGVLFASACGFQAIEIQVDAGMGGSTSPTSPGSGPDTSDDILHVGAADEYLGTADLTIDAPITIDTGAMAFGMALPAGVVFATAKQDGGPELAILHVRALAVHADVRVFGARPLVMLADSFELTETIDATAHDTPGRQDGPGPQAGPGAQTGPANPGVLAGGAPSAPASACQTGAPSGGGGGAVELYARTRISIAGNINAGGRPASAGLCPTSVIATNPFGSGGTIVLQSPVVDNSGRLSASGGGFAPGQILMLYRTKLAAGVTTPTASTQMY